MADTAAHPVDAAPAHPSPIVRLVANHWYALLEVEERGFRDELADDFPLLDDPPLVDALGYCDMTTSPDDIG